MWTGERRYRRTRHHDVRVQLHVTISPEVLVRLAAALDPIGYAANSNSAVRVSEGALKSVVRRDLEDVVQARINELLRVHGTA